MRSWPCASALATTNVSLQSLISGCRQDVSPWFPRLRQRRVSTGRAPFRVSDFASIDRPALRPNFAIPIRIARAAAARLFGCYGADMPPVVSRWICPRRFPCTSGNSQLTNYATNQTASFSREIVGLPLQTALRASIVQGIRDARAGKCPSLRRGISQRVRSALFRPYRAGRAPFNALWRAVRGDRAIPAPAHLSFDDLDRGREVFREAASAPRRRYAHSAAALLCAYRAPSEGRLVTARSSNFRRRSPQ